ncbi:MAG: hypothetical protein IJZ96_07810 [Lachnospiraceae bacterium]|nr:hypothetical protein [Lachnospiraceae bacterium]
MNKETVNNNPNNDLHAKGESNNSFYTDNNNSLDSGNDANNSNKLSNLLSKEITFEDISTKIKFNRKRIHNMGFLNTFWLKLIAIICMTIDHVGACLGISYINGSNYLSNFMDYETYTLLRTIGRLAFPIFCYMIVEGFFYTRSVLNYTVRLLIFALISQIPFSLMLYREPFLFSEGLNVYFTLSIGLIAIAGIDYFLQMSKKGDIPKPIFVLLSAVIIISATTFADTIKTDYAGYGVLVILIFYIFKDKPLLTFLALYLATYHMSNNMEMYALYALIPILLHNHKKGPSMKYFFYAYYPAHMLVLYFIWAAIASH